MFQLMRFIGIILGITIALVSFTAIGCLLDPQVEPKGSAGWYVAAFLLGIILICMVVGVLLVVGFSIVKLWKSCARNDEPALWESITNKTTACIRYFKLKLVERGIKKTMSNNSKYENLIEAQKLENETLKEKKQLTIKYHDLVEEGNNLREALEGDSNESIRINN